ncbi:MAG TPA: T9SS type A sorting domain-containing protein [Parafilimonas sp.]|nr:T9SS type A sorting domain-containing protein [Parafilimonas sp.]
MKTQFLLRQPIFFILLLLMNKLLLAQSAPAKQWDLRFGGNNASNLFTVRQTVDGGYILGGLSSAGASGEKTQPGYGQDDYWIVKTDANGNKQWDSGYGGNNLDEFTALQQTADGGYILGGSSYSDISGSKTQASRGQDDYWIVKTDANGHKLWDARFGTVGFDELTAVQQTTDGGYILGGYAGSGISGDKTQSGPGGPADYWIVKTDAAGNKIWDKVFGGTNEDDLRSIQQTSDGGYILGGSSLSNNNGDKTESTRGDWDYWIVKTDASGNKIWDKRFGGAGTDFFNSVQQTTDGGYILGGRSNSASGGDKSQGSQGSFDYWIIKINAAGVRQWDARFGGSGDDQFTTLQQTADGGYILGGYSASGISGDRTQDNWGNVDYWIVRTDANSNKLWDERFGTLAVDYLYSLQQTADYGYILGGHTYGSNGDKSQPGHGSYDYWIVKTYPDCIPQTFYADADHDGYGNPAVTIQNCVVPQGYVTNNTDCNDDDASVHAPVTYYRDFDQDNFGDANNTIQACSSTPPQGYVANADDCDDTQLLYADADNDGYGAGSPVACGVANNTDCNDNDASVHAPVTYYRDFDQDNFGDANNTIQVCSSTPPQGYVINNTDCNDNNASIHGIVITGIAKTSYKGSDLTCSDAVDGKITITANGGSGTLQYSKDSGNNYQANKVFTGLAAGAYQVKVKDKNGCLSNNSYVTIIAPPPVIITNLEKSSYNGSDITCSLSKDGEITVTAGGGTGGYKYSKNNGGSFQASNLLANLGAGIYQVVVKDTNNCKSSAAEVTIIAPPVLSVSVAATSNVTCKSGTDGSITAEAQGGKPFYLYKLNTSNLYRNINVFDSLSARMYKVTAKDANGCTATVDSIKITQPDSAVTVKLINHANACKNGSNGFILVNAAGGSGGGYLYSVNNGPYTSNNTFTNLTPGTYKITAIDSKGCTSNMLSVAIKNGPATCIPLSAHPDNNKSYTASENRAWLKLQAAPNPFETECNLTVQSNSNENIEIIVTDMYGRHVYKAKGNSNRQYKLGGNLASGVYVVQVIQGKKMQTLKVVK